jgi:hypothetical protein
MSKSFTFGLRHKSDAFSNYKSAESFIQRSNGVLVLTIRCGGELELTSGDMGKYLASRGIAVRRTVPHYHEQNGKSERYIRTIEEGGQASLADSGLPMTFWLDAVLTRQHLTNCLRTSTLPDHVTLSKPSPTLEGPTSPICESGCVCYVAAPNELRPKAGFKRFRAIFVGYEGNRVGWRVRDLLGKYSFSNDVIFNENLPGRLCLPRPIVPPDTNAVRIPSPRPVRDNSAICTAAGQAYDDVICIKELCRAERLKRQHMLELPSDIVEGTCGGVVAAIASGVHMLCRMRVQILHFMGVRITNQWEGELL